MGEPCGGDVSDQLTFFRVESSDGEGEKRRGKVLA